MYDKLGDLLNETLKSGTLPPKEEKSKTQEDSKLNSASNENFKDQKEKHQAKKNIIPKKTISMKMYANYKMLDITPDATLDEVKKAFKEKIQYFHPDKYANNKVLVEVAKKKTVLIIQSYNEILEFLKET